MISFIYWTIFVLFIIAASRIRPWPICVAVMAILVVTFGAKPAYDGWTRQQARVRLEQAKALFQALCANAGERISREVENVHGIVLLRARGRPPSANRQYALSDPYGHNCFNVDTCVEGFLFRRQVISRSKVGGESYRDVKVYDYVDYIDPQTLIRYRYTMATPTAPVRRMQTDDTSTRYGVDWRDLSTPEQRSFWIAAGSVRVVDLQTNEVIAERIGYLLDPGQGRTAGFRDPWSWARLFGPSCPSPTGHNVIFVMKVLKP